LFLKEGTGGDGKAVFLPTPDKKTLICFNPFPRGRGIWKGGGQNAQKNLAKSTIALRSRCPFMHEVKSLGLFNRFDKIQKDIKET